MKEAFFTALVIAAVLVLLSIMPGGASPGTPGIREQAEQSGATAEPGTARSFDSAADTDEPPAATDPAEAGTDAALSLPVLDEGVLRNMDLHTYLTGVLLAEMPADFEPEALKAQAVACRTYALRSYRHRRHDPAAVCTDPTCCQGWTDPASVSPEARQRVEEAVRATDGLVIRYEGQLIDATFFSCSGGRTEAAAAVWGSDLPYLQPVDSPGEEDAAYFTDAVRIPLAEFRARLQEADPAVCFPAATETWIGTVTVTPGGGVDSMELGGRVFTGTALRKLFSLRSTVFTLTLTDEEAVFETRGWGHRVGMSQWGAQAMALAGADYLAILTHYYQGVTVEAYQPVA